jgi:hypothetical protein
MLILVHNIHTGLNLNLFNELEQYYYLYENKVDNLGIHNNNVSLNNENVNNNNFSFPMSNLFYSSLGL